MRLYIKMLEAQEKVDFNYQPLLTGCLHKWLGRDNLEHGKMSLYSFSWLQNVDVLKNGIKIKNGSQFFLSFHDQSLVKTVVRNIIDNPELFSGAKVFDIHIQETPVFSSKERFLLASPVLIKRFDKEKETHYTYMEEIADEYLTETLKNKADIAGLDATDTRVYFDKNYHSPKMKIISYKGIKNKVNVCPVIVEGSPEIVAFAWNVGIGNSTGIGFGALK